MPAAVSPAGKRWLIDDYGAGAVILPVWGRLFGCMGLTTASLRCTAADRPRDNRLSRPQTCRRLEASLGRRLSFHEKRGGHRSGRRRSPCSVTGRVMASAMFMPARSRDLSVPSGVPHSFAAFGTEDSLLPIATSGRTEALDVSFRLAKLNQLVHSEISMRPSTDNPLPRPPLRQTALMANLNADHDDADQPQR